MQMCDSMLSHYIQTYMCLFIRNKIIYIHAKMKKKILCYLKYIQNETILIQNIIYTSISS